MRNVLALALGIFAASACAKDEIAPTEIYLDITATQEKIDYVQLYARSPNGTSDVIATEPFADQDINIDAMTVRLTPTPAFDPRFLLRCEGYIAGALMVSRGEELEFIDHARQDLSITMDESFANDDQDRDGYRLCGTGPENDDSPCDCDDSDTSVNPFSAEICGNGVDDDCTGQVDDGC